MVLNRNARLTVTKCSCGRIIRGSEFKKHLSNFTAEDAQHTTVKRLTACVNCIRFLKTTGNIKQFREEHANCPTGKVNNPAFIRSFEQFNPDEVDLDLEEETIAAAANIAVTAAEVVEPITSSEESEEEQEIVIKPTYDERLKEVFGDVSDDDEVKPPPPPATSSTPKKGIAAQLSNEEEEKVRISREEGYRQLKRRYAALTSNNQRLISENESLHQKVRRINETSNELEKVRCELKTCKKANTMMEEKVKNLEKVEEEMKMKSKKLQEMEKRMAEMEDYDELKKKAARLADMEKELKNKRIDIHIPIYKNCLADAPSIQEDLNTTVECFHNPQLGVNCLHMGLDVVGFLKSLRVSKVKTKIPSKLFS